MFKSVTFCNRCLKKWVITISCLHVLTLHIFCYQICSQGLFLGHIVGVSKNVTCKTFKLSKWLILANKTSEELSSRPIPPVNHKKWHIHRIWKCDKRFRVILWKLSKTASPKLCNFYWLFEPRVTSSHDRKVKQETLKLYWHLAF